MLKQYERSIRLFGEEGQARLCAASVAIFGLGGVGSYAAEALIRAGIGRFLFVDGEDYEITNLNRQLYATRESIGQPKAEAAKERARQINPSALVDARRLWVTPDSIDDIDFSLFDCVCDCVDDVRAKLLLIRRANEAGVDIISCMGAGNKLDPSAFRVDDIEKTGVCPLARVVRRECRKQGLHAKAVYSREEALAPRDGARAPASNSFVPAAAGLVLAGYVIRSIALSG